MIFSIHVLLLSALLYVSKSSAAVAQFDYIVVGGGTAGLALATRLSQEALNCTILVLEAGPAAPNELGINIPGKKGSTLSSKYDWNFTTIPQQSVRNRTFSQNRGKVLGGSSALNLMTYNRASAHEYDSWEDLGNPNWNWKTFSGMMDRSMNFTSKNTEWYLGEVGEDGPVQGTINRFIPAHQSAWVPTMNNLGAPTNKRYMAGDNLGVSYSSSSIDPTHYNRSYSANAYLPLAGPALTIMTDSRVVKVNLTKEYGNYRAMGVMLIDGTFVAANQEVILSAGSFQTPGLLELSGIGNGAILREAGIEQLIDLPGVGENLQDHIRIQSSYQVNSNYTSFDILRYNTTFAKEQLQLWMEGKVSIYDYTGSAYAFETWEESTGNHSQLLALARNIAETSTHIVDKIKLGWMSDTTIPQLEVIFSDGYTGIKGYPVVGDELYGKGFFSLIAAVMHPLSRGSVHINTSDILGKPIIDPRYLSNEYDIQAAIAAIKRCRQIAMTSPLREVWVDEYEPGLEKVNTDTAWRDFILNTTLSIYHPTGSCSMLPRTDGGVVDSHLRVYGTSNLRIVDASIMPVIISAHMQTAVYGIAEMAADIILGNFRL